jgi:hypothetical protein
MSSYISWDSIISDSVLDWRTCHFHRQLLWEIKPQETMMVQTLDASRSNLAVISLRD